jgi:hypothetical protein
LPPAARFVNHRNKGAIPVSSNEQIIPFPAPQTIGPVGIASSEQVGAPGVRGGEIISFARMTGAAPPAVSLASLAIEALRPAQRAHAWLIQMIAGAFVSHEREAVGENKDESSPEQVAPPALNAKAKPLTDKEKDSLEQFFRDRGSCSVRLARLEAENFFGKKVLTRDVDEVRARIGPSIYGRGGRPRKR